MSRKSKRLVAANGAPLAVGTVVTARWLVRGYCMSLGTDTRCIVREVSSGRVRVERDDGREGSWWLNPEATLVFGHGPAKDSP